MLQSNSTKELEDCREAYQQEINENPCNEGLKAQLEELMCGIDTVLELRRQATEA
jgi:hypothetical protein